MARILALAGFDPGAALDFFSASVAELHDVQPREGERGDTLTGRMFKLWTRTTHPPADQRMAAIKAELMRWEKEATYA